MITTHPPISIRVNGEAREVPSGETIATLIVSLGAHPEGVAVAVNGEVVPRGDHHARVLVAGDRVEVIRAVGGG